MAQGTIAFANYGPFGLDAKVTLLDGTGVGAGFTAQLYYGQPGTPVQSLQPLFPTTRFSSDPPEDRGYVLPLEIPVPGTQEGDRQTFVLRVYNGPAWEASSFRGESNPVTVSLNGGVLPTAYLVGLQPFHVVPIPEPSVFALEVLGGCLLVLLRKTRRHA